MTADRPPSLRAVEPAGAYDALRPIVILGFGRSGTTWLSDIVSKISGQLILFEPLHPSVTSASHRFAYSGPPRGCDSDTLAELLLNTLQGRHREPWLLRNHVPFPLHQIKEEFLDEIWQQCSIIGFKSIRANFMLSWLKTRLNALVVPILRNPCAVVASILNRKNFWEFGWPETYELFLQRTIYSGAFEDLETPAILKHVQTAETLVDRYTLMWSITAARLLADAHSEGLPVFYYEDLYRKPFENARKLFDLLDYPNVNVHPAHLFTPSMTSLRTTHGVAGQADAIASGPSVFWRDTLSPEQVDRVWRIVGDFGFDVYGPARYQPIPVARQLQRVSGGVT